jgi:hypothetical protein
VLATATGVGKNPSLRLKSMPTARP